MKLVLIVVLALGATGSGAGQTTGPVAVGPEICIDNAASLSDNCRVAFAERFAPVLAFRGGGCDWDESNHRPGGGYFFAAQRSDAAVRIAYMPAYFVDCGWRGPKCRIPGVDCSPHAGDSEFIVLDVVQNWSGNWRVTAIFLSAHCFGRSSPNCRWYRGADLEEFDWEGAAPVIWVAEGRNANYPSQRACNRGHHSLDTCDRNVVRTRFPVEAARDIGTRSTPAREYGCYSGAELLARRHEPGAIECFWRRMPFRGWSVGTSGVTGYDRYLSEVAGF